MRILGIELRNPRLLIWGGVIFAALLAWQLVGLAKWKDSWTDISVWSSIPFLYLSALMAAAAADLQRNRVQSGLENLIVLSGRKKIKSVGVDFLATVVVLLLFPLLLDLLILGVIGLFTAQWGSIYLEFPAVSCLLALGMIGLGKFFGTVVKSPIGAPLLGIVVGLGFMLNMESVPPVFPPWLQLSPSLIFGTVGFAVTMLGAWGIVYVGRLRKVAGQGSSNAFTAFGSMVLVAFTVTIYMGPQQQSDTTPREPISDPTCRSKGQVEVCVWPEDERFLEELLTQGANLARVSEDLPWIKDSWLIKEPSIMFDEERENVGVEPVSLGDGMWLTAQSMAFALAPACNNEDESRHEEITISLLAALDTTNSLIFEGARPSAVRLSGGGGVEDAAAKIVKEVLAKQPQEQLEWVVTEWQSIGVDCGF